MIQITIQTNGLFNYQVTSDKNVTIKNIHTGKELPQFVTITEPNTSDYIETDKTIEQYNAEQRYGELIRTKLEAQGYDINAQLAILYNSMNTNDVKADEHAKELEQFKTVRKTCKEEAYKIVYGDK